MDKQACEVIEFVQPFENEKNLLLTNISGGFEDDKNVLDALWKIFSEYGLLYEIQVKESAEEVKRDKGTGSAFYAFVKFFAASAAARAYKDLCGRLYLKGQHIRVRFANRKKRIADNHLYTVKCYELANHYLGFNGWSTQIVSMTPDEGVVDPGMMRYFCGLLLTLPGHGVTTEGVGVGQMTWNPQDLTTKSTALCMAKKRAHQRAVEAAFARIVLVVTPGGRVYCDVNSTVEDTLEQANLLTTSGVVKVNELDEQPASSENEEDQENQNQENQDQEALDLLNQQILAELEEDG